MGKKKSIGNKQTQISMTQKQTPVELSAFEWFNKLKEPYRSQAIKASEKNPYPEKQETYESLTDAIVYDFWWSETELDERWQEIHDSLERGETTYLAEQPNHNPCTP